MLSIFFLVLSVVFPNALGQYFCVPVGTCTTSTSSPNSIEPRVMTPQSSCPVGQEPCSTPPTSQCGQRYVRNVELADGPATMGAYPWLAYIMDSTGYVGVGALINPQTVLTAAHKVFSNRFTPGNIRISLGVYNPANMVAAQNRTATGVAIHPNYSGMETLINDIALVRLSSAVNTGIATNVGTACLPPSSSPGTSPYTGKSCIVAGWGQSSFGRNDAPSSPLKQVTVPIVTYQQCRDSMSRPELLGGNVDKFLDRAGEICAGGQVQRDACTQDGGAPLVCPDPVTGQFIVAGLVIWGKRCGMEGVYGVYVNVPVYRSWIDSQMASVG